MRDVVIASAVRTPIGSFNGAFAALSANDLGAMVIKEALKRAHINPEQVDEVIMGNVLQAGQGQNPTRQSAIKAGIPVEVPSYTINKLCGSGLKTVELAMQSIICGDAEIIVAGGMESMSQAPYLLDKARWGHRMGDASIKDAMLNDGLTDAFHKYHMGITAENIAEQFNISRAEQDLVALESQQKAIAAIQAGFFKAEIVPVTIPGKKGAICIDTDEYPKADVSAEKLAQLRPAFKKDGTVTSGNASGINDGAAALVVMSAAMAEQLGIKPLVKIIACASGGVDPQIMGMGPVPATQKVLAKAKLTVDDIDLIEANEAFAAQWAAVSQQLQLPKEKLNVNGGAIALGHPIGASGARILVTLIHAMKRLHKQKGLATLCIGGGQGFSCIVENSD